MDVDKISDFTQVLTHARESYQVDKNLAAIIGIYESVLLGHCPWLVTTEHGIRLVDYYIKAKERDKAWGLLNKMMLESAKKKTTYRFWRIYDRMYRICKMEGRYYDAVEHLMRSHLYKHRPDGHFNSAAFEKMLLPLLRRLNRKHPSAIQDLSNMIRGTKKTTNPNYGQFVLYDSGAMINEFRDYSQRYLE